MEEILKYIGDIHYASISHLVGFVEKVCGDLAHLGGK